MTHNQRTEAGGLLSDIVPNALEEHDIDTVRAAHRATGAKILIIGGYGQVGRMIAERLAPLFPGRVAVAGRSGTKARTAATEIGHGATGRTIDVLGRGKDQDLGDVALVLVCIDQIDTGFARRCLERGIRYLDISADYAFLSQVESLDDVARKSGATALLSVGLAPGLTNLLAARAKQKMTRVERIDILLEFGLGDRHGQAAVEWLFDNLDAEYQVREDGQMRPVRSFGEHLGIRHPGQTKGRAAYRFNFSDQHVIWRTLDVPSASTWVRFESRIVTWAFAISAKAGLGRLLRRARWRRVAVWLFQNIRIGTNMCAVAVRATGQTTDGPGSITVGVMGHDEALMTAVIAAEIARQALVSDLPLGVLHSEQAVDLDPVLKALQAEIPDITLSL